LVDLEVGCGGGRDFDVDFGDGYLLGIGKLTQAAARRTSRLAYTRQLANAAKTGGAAGWPRPGSGRATGEPTEAHAPPNVCEQLG
jgi:hypothetical protein